MSVKKILGIIKSALSSRRGHNILVFSAFTVIASLLWCVTALNDEAQADLRMPVVISHVPDSVTIVSQVPSAMSVSLRTKGTRLLQYTWGKIPEFNIDFRQYRVGSFVRLAETDLKAVARTALGGSDITVVSPDSLKLAFTTSHPVSLPVVLDYTATPGPQSTIVGTPVLSVDTVKVYSMGRLPSSVNAVASEPLRLTSLTETSTQRVRLIPPANSRIIPDSIDVTVNVEPLILKTRKVTVETVNVPEGQKLVTFPSQIEVMYMIPVSEYKSTSEPVIRVQADYRSTRQGESRTIRLKITKASDNLRNVHLVCDSAEYIIEHL